MLIPPALYLHTKPFQQQERVQGSFYLLHLSQALKHHMCICETRQMMPGYACLPLLVI